MFSIQTMQIAEEKDLNRRSNENFPTLQEGIP